MADNSQSWLDKLLWTIMPGAKSVSSGISKVIGGLSKAGGGPATTGTKLVGKVMPTAAQLASQKKATAGTMYDLFTPQDQKSAAARAAAILAATRGTTPSVSVVKPTSPITVPSNYGVGAAGAVLGKSVPTPKDSAIQKVLGTSSGGTSAGGTTSAGTGAFTADMLYQDPTSAYQPLLDMYAKQQQQLNERYAQNAADIKNIFGNLSTIRAQDKVKIAEQFKTSIEQQQAALAARTAEARSGVAAGQQGAATAAAEMGTAGQPAPTDSLTSRAAEQGIADSNAYQTTWDALQNVMSQQAQNDVQNAIQGYDYQQTAALETLRNNLEDRLAAIQQSMAGTQSDIAQAKLAGKQNVLNTKYAEYQAASAAAAKAASAAASAAAKKPSYSKDAFGLQKRAADAGINYTDIQRSVNDAYASAYDLLNPPNSTKKTMPKKADILNAWNAIKAGSPQSAAKLAPFVNQYVDQMY